MTTGAKVDEWSEKLELHKNVVSLQIGRSQDELNEILKHLPTLTGLQASLVNGLLGDGGISLSLALQKQREAARRVCVVCTPTQHLGTGFLISPQHVLTNRHVVAGASDPNQLQVVFDHIGEKPYAELIPRAVKFSSPLLASDVGDLDYAVLPLAQPAEADRGYFSASLNPLSDKNAVVVLGHPGMKDSISRRISPKELQISAGSVRDVNSESNRIAYTAWTAPGSSGSPVLNASFELIGLHHHGEHLVNNHGVIIRAIFNDLARKAPGLMQGRTTSANPNIESQVFAAQRESSESANASPTYIFEGKRKLEFEKRLLDDWRSLATLLEIPVHKRNTWEKGYEADAIWNYLNAKRELNRLPEALIYVEREDLAQLFL